MATPTTPNQQSHAPHKHSPTPEKHTPLEATKNLSKANTPISEKESTSKEADILSRISQRPWQDYAFLAMLLAILVKTFLLLSPLQQLPSPLYGGDVYYHFGVINHIYSGNWPWMHNHFLHEYAHYPWISHLLAAVIAWVLHANILATAIYFPLVTTTFCAVISYLLGISVFGNKSIALLYALFYSTFQVPNTAASPFAELVIYPLFLLMLSRANDSLQSRVLAGIAFGLTGLAQVITWVGAIMTLGLLWLWRILSETISFHKGTLNTGDMGNTGRISVAFRGFLTRAWKHARWFFPIIIVGLPIALLFWGPPLLVYHAKTPNNWSSYVSLGPTLTPAIALDTLRIWFFNTETWMAFVISISTLFGFALLIRTPNRFLIPLLTGIVPIIGLLHPFIKEIGIGFYAFGYIFDNARGLLFFTFIYVLYKSFSRAPRIIFYAATAIFLVVNASATFSSFENDRWVHVGRQPNPQYPLAQWINANTPIDAVFLTPHEETGFALNAMTGRKVLIARRTHTSPFVDVNLRVADAGIILYGTNQTLTAKLVSAYNIRYVYEDYYSIQNQAECSQAFDHLIDPHVADASLSCLRTDPLRENYINAAGLTFTTAHARLDPASNVAPLFDMLAIKPGNYSSWLTAHSRVIRQSNLPDGSVYQRLLEITP